MKAYKIATEEDVVEHVGVSESMAKSVEDYLNSQAHEGWSYRDIFMADVWRNRIWLVLEREHI